MEVKELIRLCLLGDQQGQRHLYKKYVTPMARLCQRYIKNTDDVHEVVIEGFVKIFRLLKGFEYRGEQSLEAWMRKIMVNECLMRLRKERRSMFIEQTASHADPVASDNTDISAEEILALIRLLPDGYRTVFNLAVIEGYSHMEIAEMLGISESASRSQLTHARNKTANVIKKPWMEMNDDNLDKLIRRKVRELDKSYPDKLVADDALWEEIISRKKRRQARKTIQWSVAATVLILITAGTLWRTFPTGHSHSQSLPEMTSTREDEVLEHINMLCNGNNVACHSPAFKELQEELKESSLSLMEIEKQITVFGRDENLLRAKSRIENHQVNIIRAMIQTL